MHMTQTVDSGFALQKALDSLRVGGFDHRSVEGAQANALESIAWSLAGLLAAQVAPNASAVQSAASLTEALVAGGFIPRA